MTNSAQAQLMSLTTSSPLADPPLEVAERLKKQPECRLLWAVLEQGVETYRKNAFATSRRGHSIRLSSGPGRPAAFPL